MKGSYASLFIANLPESLRQAAYRDIVLCSEAGITTVTQITLAATFRFERAAFFSAAKTAIDTGLLQLLTTDDGKSTTVRAIGGPNAHLIVSDGTRSIVMRHFELLSQDPGKRRSVLNRLLGAHNLQSADEKRWRQLCSARPFDADELDAFKRDLMDTSCGLRNQLQNVRHTNELSLDELVPRSRLYFERLVGHVGKDVLEPAQLKDAVMRAHQAVPSGRATTLLPTVLATAGSTSLLPDWVLAHIPRKRLLGALQAICRQSDPYSLAAGIELAAIAAQEEPRAGQIAYELGTRLLGNEGGFRARCQLFSALLIATSFGISQNPELRECSPAWRRLAAFSHSVIAHRALFHRRFNCEKLLEGVMRSLGTAFYISALLDKAELPLWRPLWVTPDHVEADAVGRISNALSRLPDVAGKTELGNVVATARKRIDHKTHPLAPMFPSFMEGYASMTRTAPTELVMDLEKAFVDKSPVEACAISANVAAVVDFPQHILPHYERAIGDLPMPSTASEWGVLLSRLSSAAHAAAVARSVGLADAVAEALFRALRQCVDHQPPAFEVISIICEAAGALASRLQSREWLEAKFRRLASMAPRGNFLTTLISTIDEQANMNPRCLAFFGQARAMAQLAL
jgi:hypothetical protein